MNSTTDKKARTLHLSYDPKTQRAIVLRLRARLGRHFDLQFHAIGANGMKRKRDKDEDAKEKKSFAVFMRFLDHYKDPKKKKTQPDVNPKDPKRQKKVPFPIQQLPAELVDYITTLMIKLNPTKAEIKGLFLFARSSPFIRGFFESEGLERAMTMKTLGAVHSRSREERRLGLEPNVAKRYGDYKKENFGSKEVRKGVLGLLGLPSEALQDMANRNALIYKARGSKAYGPFIVYDLLRKEKPEKEELEEEEQPDVDITTFHISAWPWWYLRLLSNYKSMVSMTHRFSEDNSDGFFAAVVSMVAKKRPESVTVLAHNDSEDMSHGDLFLWNLLDTPDRDNYKWHKWSAGADLMVIPMHLLILRAQNYVTNTGFIGVKPIQLSVYVSESMPSTILPEQGKASYRKEVVVLPEKIPKQFMLQGSKKFGVDMSRLVLTFQIHDAYLGDSLTNFLKLLRTTPTSYMQMESLFLKKLYFENPTSLDLTGKLLSSLEFGPSNLTQVPNFCPAPKLRILELRTEKDDILIWDIPDDPATCLPLLRTLAFSYDIQIRNAPEALEKFSKFPKLNYLILEGFSGEAEDLRRLGGILEQAPKAKSSRGITVVVGLGKEYGSDLDKIILKFLYANLNATFEGVTFESRD